MNARLVLANKRTFVVRGRNILCGIYGEQKVYRYAGEK